MTASIPLSRLVLVELRKAIDTRAGVCLVVLTMVGAAAGVAGTLLGSKGGGESIFHIYGTVGPAVSMLPPVIAILLVTGEWSQRTGLSTFALVPRRERIVAAKALAALVLAAGAFALSVGASAAGAAIDGGTLGLSLGELGRAALYQLVGVLGGFAFGLALLNTVPALVVAFTAPTAIGLAGELSHGVARFTRWIDEGVFGELAGQTVPHAAWPRMATVALLWIVLPLAVGLLRVPRSEVK